MTERGVLIVGAGISGLSAGRLLRSYGHSVTILDKGRGVGGRMATRRHAKSVFDHGAQYFTAREPRFKEVVRYSIDRGAVQTWTQHEGEQLYRGVDGMTSLPKLIAEGLDVHTGMKVVRIDRDNRNWIVITEQGENFTAPVLLLTCPVPQSLDLIDAANLSILPSLRDRLKRVNYAACFVALATLSGPSGLPVPGFVRDPSPSIAWIADNDMKGISSQPAITVHSTPGYAADHLEADDLQVARSLIAEIEPQLESSIETVDSHRWRHSLATRFFGEQFVWNENRRAPLYFAGDAFGGPRVEGAALSGLAAADAIAESGR